MEIGTGLVCEAAFTPLTPEPVSRSTGARGDMGLRSGWAVIAVFCIESWCSVSVRKCREVCAGFQVVKIDHPPNGFWVVRLRLGTG